MAWTLAGGASASTSKLAPVAAQMEGLRPAKTAQAAEPRMAVAELSSAPLFILTTGPGAVSPPQLRLDGVSRAHGRVAALISIDGQPAEWMSRGETRHSVTLLEASSAGATVETLLGPQDLALGQPASSSTPAALAEASQTIVDQPPPGFRPPPPPASAPGLR